MSCCCLITFNLRTKLRCSVVGVVFAVPLTNKQFCIFLIIFLKCVKKLSFKNKKTAPL